MLSNGINSDASVQKYKEEAASLGKSLEREEELRKDAEEQLGIMISRVAGAVSVPDEITVQDGDFGWRLIDGPVYLAPYTILDGEHMASAFGSSMTMTKGRLVRVRAACMAERPTIGFRSSSIWEETARRCGYAAAIHCLMTRRPCTNIPGRLNI